MGAELRPGAPVRFRRNHRTGPARPDLALASGQRAHLPQIDRKLLAAWLPPVILVILAAVLLAAFGRSWFERLRSAWQVRRIRPDRARPADAAILYEHMLRIMKKRGYQKPGWFTPREFAATVRQGAVDEFTECLQRAALRRRCGGRRAHEEDPAGTFVNNWSESCKTNRACESYRP